jgi:hypothetical protein
MVVYVVESREPYEHFSVEAIFASKEAAEKFKEGKEDEFSFWRVVEMEVLE